MLVFNYEKCDIDVNIHQWDGNWEYLFKAGLDIQLSDVSVRRYDVDHCVWHLSQVDGGLHQHHRLAALGEQSRQTRSTRDDMNG